MEFLDLVPIHFLLSVPAGEGSLAHRRHVPSQAIELDSLTDRLELEKIFGRKAPLHVDLGCGEGSFLCTLAQRMPDKNFLGIERLLNRVRASARKAASLDNVRLLRVESSYAVRYLLPAESVETFYLLFPDPWPKRRHHRRRIVTPDFLSSVHSALEDKGIIYIATDHLDYFGKIKKIAELNPAFATPKEFASPDYFGVAEADLDLPPSKFGRIFRQKTAPIYWLPLRKISPVK
ncbi:MAG: tRNA (guanosine(46)-N7)-methyltransferase TrmB [Acidobacteria bacterium]|nr:MAG: tRNA (guanosine(46)-N7)-methyltransferase TrmB [Acidobacteriota bacterium]